MVNEDITTPGGHVRPAASLNPAIGSNVDGLSVMEKDPHQQSHPLQLMVIDMIWHKAPPVVYTELHTYKQANMKKRTIDTLSQQLRSHIRHSSGYKRYGFLFQLLPTP